MRNSNFSLLLTCLLLLLTYGSASALEDQKGRKINLRQAVELALLNNLNLKLQQEEVEEAKGVSLAAEGKFDVYFSADAEAQRQDLTPLIQEGITDEETETWNIEAAKTFTTGTEISLGWSYNRYENDLDNLRYNPSHSSGVTLGIRQPLLQGFGSEIQTAELRAAQKQLEASSFELDSEAANLAADVKAAYWSLVFAWQDIGVQQLSLRLAQQLLVETEAQIAAGRLAPVDVYQPQSEVARREELLISAERAIGTAEDYLKLLLNSDDWLTTYEPTDQPTYQEIDLNLPVILENALQNRPDIKASDLVTQAANIERLRAEDDIRPDLSLVGGLGVTGTDGNYGNSVSSGLGNPDNTWQIGVTFSVPLDNSAAKGYHQQARASYNKARTSGELLRQQVRRSVRTTIRDVELALKALEATRKTSLASLKALEAEQAKFDSGRSTTLDVLIAQDAYSQALSQQNLTNITYANTLAELDRIQGLVTFSSAREDESSSP